jgi:putative ABC transport system permease protein
MPIAHGRAFTDSEVQRVRHVCVIGKEIETFLFEPEESPLGKSLLIDGLSLEVVGVLGDVDDPQLDEVVLMPITVATKKFPGMSAIRRLTVLPIDVYSVEQVHSRVTAFFSKKSFRPEVIFDEARVKAIRSILRLFNLFLKVGNLAVLSLSVVGIAIVMLAMVRERTAEIGLRKAIGASDHDITIQFGFESILVTMVGAVGGIVVGSATVVAVQEIALENSVEYEIFILAILTAFFAGVLSGIVAGILPARVAARLEPIAALRAE